MITDLIAALVVELGWPKKIERYIEVSEHMEKQVGNKKLKKGMAEGKREKGVGKNERA